MHLKTLSLVNFKNYEQVDIPLSPKINCFVGENGVGKTNLLDAIHYLSLCKSNLNPVDSQNIAYDEDFLNNLDKNTNLIGLVLFHLLVVFSLLNVMKS